MINGVVKSVKYVNFIVKVKNVKSILSKKMKIKMKNAIILSSCLLGSVYVMSKSLELINRSFLCLDKKLSAN